MQRRDFRPTLDPKDLDTWDMIRFVEVQKKKKRNRGGSETEEARRRKGEGGVGRVRRSPDCVAEHRARPTSLSELSHRTTSSNLWT